MADPGFVHLHVHSSYSLLEGALTIAPAGRTGQGRPSSRRWRSPTPTTCSVRSSFPRRWPASASSRSSAARWRSISATRRPARARQRWRRPAAARPRIVLLAAREDGYRSLMRLNSRAFLETPPNEPPHVKLAWLDGETEGLIALTGGPGGPLDAAIVAGQGSARRQRAARRWRACSATASISSCSATACRQSEWREAALDRACLCARHPAGRDQRAVFRDAGGLRGA